MHDGEPRDCQRQTAQDGGGGDGRHRLVEHELRTAGGGDFASGLAVARASLSTVPGLGHRLTQDPMIPDTRV
eukprot:980455-Rhodomonas_salina.3